MKARLFLTTLLAGYVVACFSDTLTIAMTGDIMMGTTFPEVSLPANNGKDLFLLTPIPFAHPPATATS